MDEAIVDLVPYTFLFRRSFWNDSASGRFQVLRDFGKNDRDKRKSSDKLLCLSRRARFMSAGPGPRARLCCLSGNLRSRSLFLSFSLPALHRLFSSVALRLIPMRFLFPLVFTVSLSHGTCTPARSLLGPRCCQIVRESHGQKASAMLYSRELRSSVSFSQSFTQVNLIDSISLKAKKKLFFASE